MTPDILQSDILLAIRLVGEQRTDEEILQSLSHRGVDAVQAAKLLDDLRNGRKPEARSPLPPELSISRRSRSRRVPREAGQALPIRPSSPEPERQRSAGSIISSRGNLRIAKVVVAGLFVLTLVLAGILLLRRSGTGSKASEGPQSAPATVQQAVTRPAAPPTENFLGQGNSSAPLMLELRSEGLRIGGSLVTAANLLSTVAQSLGAPARTNQATQAGPVIYAYDNYGLLVYSQPGGRTNHIVLDCDATGGANGTTAPFVGTLKVEDQLIGPDTDSQTLAGIKKLGLSSSRSDGTIWGGRYNSLNLVFAYLKTPQRPSLIEIDLK
jgi:hypothetical protein